jgi:hypothetical protein
MTMAMLIVLSKSSHPQYCSIIRLTSFLYALSIIGLYNSFYDEHYNSPCIKNHLSESVLLCARTRSVASRHDTSIWLVIDGCGRISWTTVRHGPHNFFSLLSVSSAESTYKEIIDPG